MIKNFLFAVLFTFFGIFIGSFINIAIYTYYLKRKIKNTEKQTEREIKISTTPDGNTIHMNKKNWDILNEILLECRQEVKFHVRTMHPPFGIEIDEKEQTVKVPLSAWTAMLKALDKSGHNIKELKMKNFRSKYEYQ